MTLISEVRSTWRGDTLLLDRILTRTRIEGDCLIWTGWTSTKGYGRISYQGRTQRLHRLIWSITNNQEPGELHVRHTCDTPPCWRPDHLLIGTHQQNMADKVQRGRHQNQLKTHCPKDHPYDDENTIVFRTDGYRRCRICKNANARARRALVRTRPL